MADDEAGRAVGAYDLKPNRLGLGDHVCSAGYVVVPDAPGRGIASAMCEHSKPQAVAMGFRAMRFNLVFVAHERSPLGKIRLRDRRAAPERVPPPESELRGRS